MDIPKAIKILSLDLTYSYPAMFNDLQDAIKLGNEALKAIMTGREDYYEAGGHLLPGETED